MAPQAVGVASLRAASFRISSASKTELPHVVACVAQSLTSSRDILAAPEQKDSDASVVLHRFNTQISTLLQDRTVEGRWAATVLVKAAIEAGGWETLRKCNVWVRPLLANLKKPDPPITRCLCIIALTRIFMLTWDYPTLVREITTPALPTFVATCLNNLTSRRSSPDELKTTLESFAHLIPRHPTIFRSHQDAIGKLLLSVLEGQASHDQKTTRTVAENVKDLAFRVSVLLHQCEPKGGASDKWQHSFNGTVQAAHSLADKTLIAIDEDWQSAAGSVSNKRLLGDLYSSSQRATAASARPVAQFIVAGSEGLRNHLRLLATYFSVGTPSSVDASLGKVTDLLTRLFAVTVSQNASRTSVRFKQDASREEREALAQVLPEIHVASMEVLSSILDRYTHAVSSSVQSYLDQLLWIFHADSKHDSIRTAVYALARRIIDLSGPSMSKQAVVSLRRLVTACCDDLLPVQTEQNAQQPATANGKSAASVMNADTFLKQPSTTQVSQTRFPGLTNAARDLLPSLLRNLPAKYVPVAVRTRMDRTATLTRHKDAMVASVLNPPATEGAAGKGNSLLPLLAREFPEDARVEALIRPRMPVIQTGRRSTGHNGSADDEPDVDMDEDAEPSVADEADADAEAQNADEDVVQDSFPQQLYASASASAAVPVQPPAATSAPADNPIFAKRPRSSSPRPQAAEKRQRASPVAQSFLDSAEAELPGSAASAVLDVPSGQTVATMSGATSQMTVTDNGQGDSDDEDFVVPPLVLDGDSDEDEDDEDE
ncbi:hypothetical protein MBLNU459_g5393t1 [Dothideomycetes sp. NU459]